MSCSFVARMLFAVTVMVAALLLVPTSSFAHAGHDHGLAATEASKQVPGAQTRADGADKQASSSASTNQQVVVALLPVILGKAKIVCMGGCCSAASASCCAISVPALLGQLEPPFGHAVFTTVQSEGTGIVPGTLPEPPKSLV
jgi:hypothetical protein